MSALDISRTSSKIKPKSPVRISDFRAQESQPKFSCPWDRRIGLVLNPSVSFFSIASTSASNKCLMGIFCCQLYMSEILSSIFLSFVNLKVLLCYNTWRIFHIGTLSGGFDMKCVVNHYNGCHAWQWITEQFCFQEYCFTISKMVTIFMSFE